MENPKVKKGDKIILKECKNSQNAILGRILTVQYVSTTALNVLVDNAEPQVAGAWNIYLNSDLFVLADRKTQAEYLINRNAELQKIIAENVEEIRRLKDFETEEDFVADKLRKLFEAKDDVKKMSEILKTLKESHYL